MSNQYPEHKIVQQCLSQIESQLQWGKSVDWHNDVFLELSEKIQQKTGVLLSPTTLKRVWGKVNYKSAPSISTLNTLSQFAGYENWRAFKNQSNQSLLHKIQQRISPNLGVIMSSAAIMTLVFISLYSLKGNEELSNFDSSNIIFKSKTITEGLPNTVVFDLDLQGVQSDSIYIQQFWDPTKTIKLKSNQKQATGIYYFPGYFKAKLLVDGKKIKEHDLFIKSNGWSATIDYEPIPKFLKQSEIVNQGMSLPKKTLEMIKKSNDRIDASFHYVKDFGDISGDNFTLKTSIQSLYADKWAVCQKNRIVILGTNGAHIIPFSIPGCASDIDLLLNDVFLKGKEHDLSVLGTDFSSTKNIELKIVNKQLTVFIEGEKVFTQAYNESIGRLVGIRYRFTGAFKIHDLEIIDSKTNSTVLSDNFIN
jgi:hypothetical protein